MTAMELIKEYEKAVKSAGLPDRDPVKTLLRAFNVMREIAEAKSMWGSQEITDEFERRMKEQN